MSLIQLNVDLNEVTAIRKALQELVLLFRSKLLADGYLQPPPDRVPTTPSDVRIVDGRSVWQEADRQKLAEKRAIEQLD